MEMVLPLSGMDFDYNSMPSSPYLSAPSTPTRYGNYFFSAPTSPSRMSEFYREFDSFSVTHGSNKRDTVGSSASSSIPFDWEDKPGTPKSSKATLVNKHDNDDDDEDFDFAFFVSEEVKKASLSAEELFDGGKIKPLKPPPRLQVKELTEPKSPLLAPRSQPRSPIAQGKKKIRNAFSPKGKKESDPFATVTDKTRKRAEHERGRDRTPSTLSSSNSGRRATRSHSPYRVSPNIWEEEQHPQQQNNKQPSLNSKPSLSSSKGSRKWRLRDFLLFRSASEGRATDKDPFRKYSVLHRKT
ncbi:AR781, pheromone receptor-like protein [Quillaja saponaria]|uniref:AR781, pheromone receptor-like protein n=1 Tax=Quillaja saponaria TaxID=32244 RepID=A0AAD7PKE9_QUISA|nr:AR781, pheromone receptor-like protein [Quillaja saponaria]